MSLTRVAALAATLLPILILTTWPFRAFVGHAHWAQVEWVPFTQKVAPLDFLANTLLFVPFGAALAWGVAPRATRRAAIVGLAVSILIEGYQVYAHMAFPTVADAIANTAGAWLGAQVWIGLVGPRRRSAEDARIGEPYS